MGFSLRRRTQLLIEYSSKGAFLGLLFSLPASDAGRGDVLFALAWPAGLVVASIVVLAFRAGGFREPWPPRLALALLHHTLPVYASILAGLAVGAKAPVGLKALAFGAGGALVGIALRAAVDPAIRRVRLASEVGWIAFVV